MPPSTSPREISLDEQALALGGLSRALSEPQPGQSVELIETHISWVLVAGDDVYKFKKVLNTDFLDYTTLARRLHCCEEELRLNRRLAPELYLGIVALTGLLENPVLNGDSTVCPNAVLDYAVHMRAFDQRNLWNVLAMRSALTPDHVDELVALLTRFHEGAAVATPEMPFGTPAQVRSVMLDNITSLDALLAVGTDRESLRHIRDWESAAWPALARQLAARQTQGRVRECHGDLHLGNITLVAGHVTVFDGIEFNDALRWMDVMGELAFVSMDLRAHGLPGLAHRCVNGYLQASGDYAGMPVLNHYLVHTALVRAKVAALRGQSADELKRYLALALQFTQARHPALMITHGLSGSGKTTLTQELLEATGAVRIRADIERKRLAGLSALARSTGGLRKELYGAAMSTATYARLRELAALVLDAGWHVILDATFLMCSQRQEARQLADALGVPFYILHFDADPAVLRERVRQRQLRGDDASEADEHVLAEQQRTAEPFTQGEIGVVFTRAEWAALSACLSGIAEQDR